MSSAVPVARRRVDWGPTLLVALGLFLAVVFVGQLAVSADRSGSTLQYLLEGAFGVALPAVLLAAARWLARQDLDADYAWRASMWSMGGFSVLTLLTAFRFYVDSLGGGLPAATFETLVLNAQVGAVAGVLVGVYDARARRNADRAEQARDQYRLLAQLLRHNVLNSVQLVEAYLDSYRRGEVAEAALFEVAGSQFDAVESLIEQARTLERASDDDRALEPVDLAGSVRRQVEVFRSSYADATFETDLPGRAPVVADSLVDALVENLLSNAVEHSDSPDPTVRVTVEHETDGVLLSVVDDGPGIPDEMKESVFDVEETGTPHGIGLYLVDTLVTHYGGAVWVEDSEPGGARLCVRLRAAEAERAAAGFTDGAAGGPAGGTAGGEVDPA